jgi:Serine/threonine protein phosphatase
MFGFGRCFACGSSVIGPSHLLHGIVNQDAFLFKKRRKYSLFVVSDGMGSKPFSDIGSKMACESVSREIERFVKNLHERVSVSRLFENIVETWKKSVLPHEAKECSATCLFVLVTKNKILVARLGDGMVCLLGNEASQSIALTDDKEGSFSNATCSLSDSLAVQEFRYAVYDRLLYKGVVLSTDGISADMNSGKEIPFAEDIFCELKKMFFWKRNSFLRNVMNHWPVPHHTDDKTLVVAGV